MCGRYNISKLKRFIEIHRWIQGTLVFEPHYNAAPTQMLPVVTASRRIELFKWGLIPHWAKDAKQTKPRFIARAETLAEKPSFKKLLGTKHCIIPADGFYEWKQEGAHKIPYYISLASGEPMAFAGLWDTWQSPTGVINSFTMITTTPNSLMARIHDRMPVILAPELYLEWLDHTLDLGPYPADQMTARPISSKVNNTRNNSPDILEP
ncbi:MAG TPA: SOS response-associated peptidase [Phycisphaerae bacterium]|nr:SOS response-associated peptidase [Phycisphaerae bacterium]